jgi:CheY-like chemotaxis protein
MIVGMLSDLGYRTLVARTGPEAMAILDHEGCVDLLFTDIVMPAGISGVDLARAALRSRPDLKILLTSGYAGAEPEAQSARREFPFIAKPYRAPALSRKLKEILAGRVLPHWWA